MSKVIKIEKRHPKTALENLNRLTGLDFHDWPESLLKCGEQVAVDHYKENHPQHKNESTMRWQRRAHHNN